MSLRIFGLSVAVIALTTDGMAQPYYPPPPAPYYQQQQYPQQYPQGYSPQPTAGYPPVYQPAPPVYQPAPQPVPQAQAAPTDTQNGHQETGHVMSLHEKLAARDQSGQNGVSTVIKMAVGDANNANSVTVMPLLEGNASKWLSLVPDESNGSFESATGVCLGMDAAALVQMDSAVARAHSRKGIESNDPRGVQSCMREMHIVGAVYPVYAFVIVRADNKFSDMATFMTSPPSHGIIWKARDRKWVVAVGSEGSGNEATMNSLMAVDKDWAANAVPTHVGGDEALSALAQGSIDAYVVVEPLNSDFINNHVNTFDGGGKFKFLSVNPPSSFFNYGYTDVSGEKHLMYQQAELPGSHWYHRLNTVGTDMVLIVNTRFASTNSWGVKSLREDMGKSIKEIRQQTATPDDWRPASRLANN